MKKHIVDCQQIINILTFVNKYGYFNNRTNRDDTRPFLEAVSTCASNLGAWDLDIKIDRDNERILFDFYCPSECLNAVWVNVDFDEIAKEYDLDKLDSYTICNKGLD